MSLPAAAAALAAAAVAAIAIASGDSSGGGRFSKAAAELGPKQLAGQRIVASYAGTEPPKRLLRMVRRGHVAGVILFSENIANRRRLAAVATRLQRAAQRSSLPQVLQAPLLVMVDQEGGAVRRLPGAPRRSQAEIGDSRRPGAAARKSGRAAAKNLSEAGLNLNLAPVLGVSRGAGGALESTGRTYGRDAGEVGRLTAAFIEAHQAVGPAATAKHFPGLGAAPVNTDDAAVRIPTRLGKLRGVDEAPYRRAISAGVGLVMLSNAIYPALDRRRPAGLSRTVIEDELRDRLGFEGVTITDALEANGLGAFGPVAKRGLRAARAGSDLLLFSSRRTADAQAGWKRVVKALRSGKLNRERSETSAARVLALRDAL